MDLLSENNKASFLGLGSDILAIVVDLLQDPDVKSMSLVHKLVYQVARYSFHRSLVLDMSGGGFGVTAKRLEAMQKDGLLSALRSVEVHGFEGHGLLEDEDTIQQSSVSLPTRAAILHRLLPCMTGLKHLKWRGCDIPREILDALNHSVNVKLWANPSRLSQICQYPEDRALERLKGNRNLYGVDIELCYEDAEQCLAVTRRVKDILLSCPNVRVLKVDIGMPTQGCCIYEPTLEYCGFGFHDTEKPPPLEELNIIRYPFGQQYNEPKTDDYSATYGQVNCQGYPEAGEEEDYWAETFDWSLLRKLQTPSVSLALKLMPKLISLKEITLHRGGDMEDAIRFYTGVPSVLEAISVERIQDITPDGVVRHGASLRSLNIHQTEDYQTSWSEQAIDSPSLQKIRDGCPRISELSLDIARDGDWPYSTLDILASFPRLRTLTIWFELGVGDREKPVEPYLTFTAAITLFTYLRKRNSRLRNLTLYSGSPPSLGFGYPSEYVFWPGYNSTRFDCALSARDDEAASGTFTTTCPELGARENAWLRARHDQPFATESDVHKDFKKFKWRLSSDPNELQERRTGSKDPEGLMVALKGPKPIDEWIAHY